jgi:uncharacterized protein
MLLDLSEIVMRDGMKVEMEIDQPSVEDPDLVFDAPIQGSLVFENSGQLLNIHGTLNTALVIPCSRCLKDVRTPVELGVHEHYRLEEVQRPDQPQQDLAEAEMILSTIIYLEQGRPILDLDELMRQLIVAEVPMRVLCDDACAGLCPRCGVNRNDQPCTCETVEANRPLAGLAALLGDESNDQPEGGNGSGAAD